MNESEEKDEAELKDFVVKVGANTEEFEQKIKKCTELTKRLRTEVQKLGDELQKLGLSISEKDGDE